MIKRKTNGGDTIKWINQSWKMIREHINWLLKLRRSGFRINSLKYISSILELSMYHKHMKTMSFWCAIMDGSKISVMWLFMIPFHHLFKSASIHHLINQFKTCSNNLWKDLKALEYMMENDYYWERIWKRTSWYPNENFQLWMKQDNYKWNNE